MRRLDPYVFLCFLTVPPLNPNLVFCSTCLQRVSERGYKETATDCEYLPTAAKGGAENGGIGTLSGNVRRNSLIGAAFQICTWCTCEVRM